MKIKIIAKTSEGEDILKKLFEERDRFRQRLLGIQKELSFEPVTLIVTSKELIKIPTKQALQSKQFVKEIVDNWRLVLHNNGAEEFDCDIEII